MIRRIAASVAVLAMIGAAAVVNVPSASGSPAWHRACDRAVGRGEARCFALWSADDAATRATASATTPPKHAYTPADMVDAYRNTVLHLRDYGLLAAPRIPEMRLLWRSGGTDRELVQAVASRWEVAAA